MLLAETLEACRRVVFIRLAPRSSDRRDRKGFDAVSYSCGRWVCRLDGVDDRGAIWGWQVMCRPGGTTGQSEAADHKLLKSTPLSMYLDGTRVNSYWLRGRGRVGGRFLPPSVCKWAGVCGPGEAWEVAQSGRARTPATPLICLPGPDECTNMASRRRAR